MRALTKFSSSLDPMTERVKFKLTEVNAELVNLPDPPTHTSIRIILDTMNSFDAQVQRCIEGQWPDNDFKLRWRHNARLFRDRIAEMRPVLVVRSPSQAVRRAVLMADGMSPPSATSLKREPPEPITLDSEPETEPLLATPTKRRRIGNDVAQRAMLTPQRSSGLRQGDFNS